MALTGSAVESVRGKIQPLSARFEPCGIPVMPTYDPVYLLKNPDAKRTVWEDMKLVLSHLAEKPSQRGGGASPLSPPHEEKP
jgi:DNA polymerase